MDPRLVLFGCLAIALIAGVAVLLLPLRAARQGGVPLRGGQLLGMHLRGANVGAVIAAASRMRKVGVETDVLTLEAHALAGGHLDRLAEAAEAGGARGDRPPVTTLMAIDLAGYDPVAAAASGDASGWFSEQILSHRAV